MAAHPDIPSEEKPCGAAFRMVEVECFAFLSALSMFGIRRSWKRALHDRAADFRNKFLFIDFEKEVEHVP